MPLQRFAAVRIAFLLLCAALGVASAQRYLSSTLVSGVVPIGPVPALQVSVGHVQGVAADRAGNVYFGSAMGCIFKLDAGGWLYRVAGTCRAGFSGDGGPATVAQMGLPKGVALDSNSNLYVSEATCRVRKVTSDGIITTIAGTGACALSTTEGGPAKSDTLNYPGALTVDSLGAVYVAEYNRVRKISPAGTIATVATVAGTAAGLVVDSEGNLYIGVGEQVFKVTARGAMLTFAGQPNLFGDSGDGGPALNASFNFIIGLALDAAGNLIVGDGTLRSISPSGIVRTIEGSDCCAVPNVYQAWQGGSGDVALDGSGSIYVGLILGDVLRKITPAGVVTDAAGTDNPTYVGDGGPALGGLISNAEGVAVDASGNVYVADFFNSRVRKITPDGIISTFAGNGISGFSGDNGPATSAQLAGPTGLAIDSAGNLFIAEYLNNRVRKVTPDGNIVTFAGFGGCCALGDGGPATQAFIPLPHGVAVDSAGNLYITEWPDSRIRKVTTDGIIATVAGNGTRGYSGDGGLATDAQLDLPWGLAVDKSGTIYVADDQNLGLRKISPEGIITSIATSGFNLRNPTGVALDAAGNLFTSNGLKVSSSGKLSYISAYDAAGQQQFVNGTAIAVDSAGKMFVVGGTQVQELGCATIL